MCAMGLTAVYFSLLVMATVFLLPFALIPDYIQVCQAKDPNIGACINNSVNHLRPRLKSGIPELDLPPLEPLLLGEIRLNGGPSGAAMDCNITSLKVWGPASFIITELRPDVRNNKFSFKLWLPRLHFKGRYKLDMRILLINVRGNGPLQGNFTDYRADVTMKGRKILKDNEEYLKFDKIRIRLDIGKAKIRLENLFNSDPVLRQVADDLVSDNSDIFVNEIKPALEHTLSAKFIDIANKITLRFTYKELFP